MKSKLEVTKTVILELSELEAKELKNLVQNPISAFPEDFRKELWENLNSILGGNSKFLKD